MSVIIATRLYTGLVSSVETANWNPSGVPAIYKLLERFVRLKIPLKVFFFCKTPQASKSFKRIKYVYFADIDLKVCVIPYYRFPVKRRSIQSLLNGIIHMAYFSSRLIAFRSKPDLIYVDRAHIPLAFLASILGWPTVIRFLGIANFKSYTTSALRRYLFPLPYWLLKKRYTRIICSEDGSPSRPFFKKSLHPKTPCSFLLNGIAPDAHGAEGSCQIKEMALTTSIRERFHFNNVDTPIFLFVGRLDKDKGIHELIQALILMKQKHLLYYTLIVCGGSDPAPFQKIIDHYSLSAQVKFEKRVPHKRIHEYYRQTDVYISLNQYGNLSNTVLEAMSYGKCIVMLGSDQTDHTDEATDKLIPAETVIRLDRNRIVASLTDALEDLCRNRKKIADYSIKMERFAQRFLWPWDERIDHEIKLLDLCH